MGRLIARNRSVDSTSTITARRAKRRNLAVYEALENRHYMSLTVEVRTSTGASSATVTSVGEVLNLDVYAVVTGANLQSDQDAVQDVTGSFISSAAYSNAIDGNLAATVIGPFDANGYQNGTQQDLNGDGNIDVGSNTATAIEGYFFARDAGVDTNGTNQNGSLVVQLGTLTYTVTNLSEGGQTDINFVPRPSSPIPGTGYYSAVWTEDNADANDIINTFEGGSPFEVTDPAINPPPVAGSPPVETITRNTPTTVNVLSSVTSEDALVDSSVTVASLPSHGTAVVQSNGSILYTPDHGYTGTDSLTYHVTDANGKTSNNGTVSFDVVPPSPPVAVADTASTLENQAVTISVLSNDTDSSGTIVPSSVAVSTAASHGTAAAQSNGTIIYTPTSGYVGTDTFSYTVSDSLGDTSSPATVTITISSPVPPTAVNDTASAVEGAPTSIDVLSNDISTSAALAPSTVAVVTDPAHGTAVPQSDGTILFTGAPGYVGADSFTYTVADALGDVSNVATVAVTITQATPPTANAFTATAASGAATSINVLDNATGVAPLVPSSVTISTAPVDGTATVNASNGSVLYTPKAGFIGADTFSYTVTDTNDNTSAPATVTVNVGSEISSAKGGNRSIIFTDATGGVETVTLSTGTAEVYFSGNGTSTTTKSKTTVTGSGLEIGSIVLSGTTKSSALVVRGIANKAVTIGGITDSSPLGTITAKSATLSGVDVLNGIASLSLAGLSNATMTIDTGVPRVALSLGTVSDSSLGSGVAITSLNVTSWTNAVSTTGITGVSINSLVSQGAFTPTLNLSASPVSIGAARIGGALGGAWTASGKVTSIAAGSVNSTWAGQINGALTSMTVKTGGLADDLIAGSIGSLVIGGDLTGNITAASVKTIRVNGNITGSTLDITGAGGLSSLTALSLTNSNIFVDVTPTLTLAAATSGALGTATIGSIDLTARGSNAFANSSIFADKIRSLALGTVNTDNSSTPEGVATNSIASVTGVFGSVPVHLSPLQLSTETILQTYLEQQSIAFGDFEISIL